MHRTHSFVSRIVIGVLFPVLIIALLLTTGMGFARAGDSIGSIKRVRGQVMVERDGVWLTAREGRHLQQGDALITRKNASVGVIFKDDTILSLGEDSRVDIDSFIFDPANASMNFVTRVGKGTAQYISGKIAKLSPDTMRVETPLSTIGIRGTRFIVKVD